MPLQAARTITAENQWTTPIQINGWFNVTISNDTGVDLGGTTVTVQRSYDNITYRDVDIWTKPSEDVGFEPDVCWYTIGVKSGQYAATCYVGFGVTGSMRA